jgi:hypothetical protein
MDAENMTHPRRPGAVPARRRPASGLAALAVGFCLLTPTAATAQQTPAEKDKVAAAPTLEETRLRLGKWMETQQLIAKERKDWQQGKEVLAGRLELVKKEIAALEDKIQQAEAGVAKAAKKRGELQAENDQLKATGSQLGDSVAAMEIEVRRLFKMLPEPLQTRLQPLHQRMPAEATTRVTTAERFQNVIGILNEVNKANNEIAVAYEVQTLADGKRSEVRSLYIGLAQAFYVSSTNEGGIGRPSAEGWQWSPSKTVANDVVTALEIIQGKQTPAFVPLPVKLQ